MLIGRRIQEIRQVRGYSQESIANDLGISQVAYSKIERNETDVTFSRLEQIAKILNVEMSTFLKPDKAVVIVGDVGHNSPGNGLIQNSHIHSGDFTEERQSYQKHIESLEKQIQHLQKTIETLLGKR